MPQNKQHKEQCGFFTIAQNTEDCDYVRLAYLLALSIKATQSKIKSFAVAVDDPDTVPEKYRKVRFGKFYSCFTFSFTLVEIL